MRFLDSSVRMSPSIRVSGRPRMRAYNRSRFRQRRGAACRVFRCPLRSARCLADASKHQPARSASDCRIARPINSGICGTTALPKARNRSTREGTPSTTRPTSGSTSHQPERPASAYSCRIPMGLRIPSRCAPLASATTDAPPLALVPAGSLIRLSAISPHLMFQAPHSGHRLPSM